MSTIATKDNYLILAGRLKPREYISFNRQTLDVPTVQAALKAQYGERFFTVGAHGQWLHIIREDGNHGSVVRRFAP